jgi:hypothetical protein
VLHLAFGQVANDSRRQDPLDEQVAAEDRPLQRPAGHDAAEQPRAPIGRPEPGVAED